MWLGVPTPGVEDAFKAAERIARTRELTNPAAAGGELDPAAMAQLTMSMMGDLRGSALSSLSELLPTTATRSFRSSESATMSYSPSSPGRR